MSCFAWASYAPIDPIPPPLSLPLISLLLLQIQSNTVDMYTCTVYRVAGLIRLLPRILYANRTSSFTSSRNTCLESKLSTISRFSLLSIVIVVIEIWYAIPVLIESDDSNLIPDCAAASSYRAFLFCNIRLFLAIEKCTFMEVFAAVTLVIKRKLHSWSIDLLRIYRIFPLGVISNTSTYCDGCSHAILFSGGDLLTVNCHTMISSAWSKSQEK